MGRRSRRKLEGALRAHYTREREGLARDVTASGTGSAQVNDLVAAMMAEDSRGARMRGAQAGGDTLAFVAAQVRYIPVWVWAAHATLVGVMAIIAAQGFTGSAVVPVVGVLSAMSVLVGLPVLQASRTHQMAELEYACRNNAASVMVARMIVLGCASALAALLMVVAAVRNLQLGAFTVALWSCPPYFCSCAGALLLLRRLRPTSALPACVTWVLICCGALLGLGRVVPGLYTGTSLATWALAAAATLAWLARESVLTIRAAIGGLDALYQQPVQISG